MRVIIEYKDDADCVSDFRINNFMRKVEWAVKADFDVKISVSNATPIKAVMAAIAEGTLPYQKILFLYDGNYYDPTIYGTADASFLQIISLHESMTERILQATMKIWDDHV